MAQGQSKVISLLLGNLAEKGHNQRIWHFWKAEVRKYGQLTRLTGCFRHLKECLAKTVDTVGSI